MNDNLTMQGWLQTDNENHCQVFIVNSCTVTQKSDHEARKLIHNLNKNHPGSFIVLAGCYSQGNELANLQKILPEVNLFSGNITKYNCERIIKAFQEFKSSGQKINAFHSTDIGPSQEEKLFNLKESEFSPSLDFNPYSKSFPHSRALVKIQDGCNFRCTYCIVPFVRGNNRSVSAEFILKYLQNLYDKGFHEAILTGIHIGTYGKDFNKDSSILKKNANSLLGLLHQIEKSCIPIKIRLSSLDCNEISPSLIEFLKTSKKIQPHLHIPMQSGSDAILKRMKRNYSAKKFSRIVEKIALSIKDVNIGTDIIVGFPGETENDFLNTKSVFESLPLNYGHIFTYSKRPNTPAAGFNEQLEKNIKKNRSKILQSISLNKKEAFLQQQIGKKRDAIILSFNSKDKKGKNQKRVITDNYLELLLKGENIELNQGQSVQVIVKIDKNKIFGEIASNESFYT